MSARSLPLLEHYLCAVSWFILSERLARLEFVAGIYSSSACVFLCKCSSSNIRYSPSTVYYILCWCMILLLITISSILLLPLFSHVFLPTVHADSFLNLVSLQGWTTTTKHGVKRKTKEKDEKNSKVFRKSLKKKRCLGVY